MEFVRRNRRNIALRAAFIVAFFASFFTNGQEYQPQDPFELGLIDLQQPKEVGSTKFDCVMYSTVVGEVVVDGVVTDGAPYISKCKSHVESAFQSRTYQYTCSGSSYFEHTEINPGINGVKEYTHARLSYSGACDYYGHGVNYSIGNPRPVTAKLCPPDTFPNHSSSRIVGELHLCYDPAELQAYYDAIADENRADENCSNLMLDSGNNNNAVMCYSSPTGNSCNVKMVQGAGYDYYVGVSANPLGCANSENPPFDNSGIGNENDKCVNVGQGNYCAADKSKHCTGTGANEVCDEGCLSFDTLFMCDASKHPDVGEGDSDYFNDKGTCSVISASAYKGLCEEYGGEWSEEGDFQEANCPSSPRGSCSVPSASYCGACLDNGGVWTPDESVQTDPTQIGLDNIAQLTKKSNDSLNTLELTTRKGNESVISTIKSTNNKLLGELKTLTGNGSGGIGAVVDKLEELKEEEKESFTVTTQNKNRTKFDALFNGAAVNKVKSDTELLKQEVQTEINNIRAEASSLLTVTVPSSVGYQARSLNLTQGNFDVSLGRFSEFFKMLSGAVMVLCAFIAAFIILGSND